jgi:antitoxin (DNA-binding transcriptional repressor) of toxin-antitoxin stability system
MIEAMVTVRITEAELARDIHAVLARVRDEGVEVIVEQDHRPVAVIKTPQSPARKISECIGLAKAYEERLGHTPVPDADFAGDVQAAVNGHREPLNQRSEDDPEVQDTGEVPAAMKNREISARLQIIGALQSLGIPYSKWPDFAKSFYAEPRERVGFTHSDSPPPFQPADFDRLRESPGEWAKAADKAWRQHRDRFLRECQSWVILGVDVEIPPAKSVRGAGRKGRRRNAPPGLRFKWAALRLSGAAWKEIADESFKENHVKKAASEVLSLAGWPTNLRKPKTKR